MDSVETAANSPRARICPTAGALITEVAARVAELARTIHDLERLIELPASTLITAAHTDSDTGTYTDPRNEGRARSTRPERSDGDASEFSLFTEESNLTKREADVLRHLLDGHSNRRISRSLRISESTVKNHLHAIFVKLDTRDRTQVVAKVYRFMAEHSTPPLPTGQAAATAQDHGGEADDGHGDKSSAVSP